ncbi:MAG: type II toxin-antitoxin system RelE/ParE family toxin [Longimicrobiales bacterium]
MLTPDAERECVEDPLLGDPAAGAIVPGTGGFRKLRVPLQGRGKRGGGRVMYYHAAGWGRIYLVAFFAKNVKEDLTKAERNALMVLARELEADR